MGPEIHELLSLERLEDSDSEYPMSPSMVSVPPESVAEVTSGVEEFEPTRHAPKSQPVMPGCCGAVSVLVALGVELGVALVVVEEGSADCSVCEVLVEELAVGLVLSDGFSSVCLGMLISLDWLVSLLSAFCEPAFVEAFGAHATRQLAVNAVAANRARD